jgi:hypothetical protein
VFPTASCESGNYEECADSWPHAKRQVGIRVAYLQFEKHFEVPCTLVEEGPPMERLIATFDFLFGCHHSHLSRVFTIDGRTYRVCCNCGAKFKYSLMSMRMEPRFRALDADQLPT